MKTHLLRIATFLAILTGGVTGEEVLLHNGPEVSLGVESIAGIDGTEKELVFRKKFFIDSAALAKLPPSSQPVGNPAISLDKALEIAKATVDLGERKEFKLVRQELLKSTTPRPVDFYLIEMLVNGSTEHRIILMDGSVIKPRLTQRNQK